MPGLPGLKARSRCCLAPERPAAPGASHARCARRAGGSAEQFYKYALHGFVFKGSAKAAAALAKNPRVRTIVPNRTIHATGEAAQAGVKRIRADHPTQPDAHDSGFTGAGVRVAVLDSGVAAGHVDLAPAMNLALSTSFVPGEAYNATGTGFNHGTHVAGIIAARANGIGTVGVAPGCEIVAVKVLSAASGSGSFGGIINGIY